MMHTILINVHAVAATIALLAGLLAWRYPRFTALHALGTIVMTVSLIGAVWLGRSRNPVFLNGIFGALLVLAVVMCGAGVRAWRERPRRGRATSARYVSAIGFNSISLVTGLVAIAVLRAGWGPIAIVVAGVLPTLIARIPLNRAIRARREVEAAGQG